MDVENVIYIFAYNFANVGMKPVCKGWNIFVHLYNKKVLKYDEQDVILFVNLVWVIVEVPLLFKQNIRSFANLCFVLLFQDKIRSIGSNFNNSIEFLKAKLFLQTAKNIYWWTQKSGFFPGLRIFIAPSYSRFRNNKLYKNLLRR